MYENPRKDFAVFRNYVLENQKAKKTYFIWKNSLKVPSDTIIHSFKRHNLLLNQWLLFLNNYENVIDERISRKSKYNGKAYKQLIQTNGNKYYGCVIEYFEIALPILTTAFEDHVNSIRSWLNE